MTWGTYDAQLPPLLLDGDVVQFQSAISLASLIVAELSHQRLLCINLADFPLNDERELKLRVKDQGGEVKVRGAAVHRQADLVGLQMACGPETLAALRALAGARAVEAVARAPVAAPIAAPVVPTMQPLPNLPFRESPPSHFRPGIIVMGPEDAPEPEPEPAGAEAPVDLQAGVIDSDLWTEVVRDLSPGGLLGLMAPLPALPVAPVLSLPFAHPAAPAAAVGLAPIAPTGFQSTTEHGTFFGGQALLAFDGTERRPSLFSFLVAQARKPTPGQLLLRVDRRSEVLTIDARGGISAFEGDFRPPPVKKGEIPLDPGTIRAERRKRLISKLSDLGTRLRIDFEFSTSAPKDERGLSVLEVAQGWVDAASANIGVDGLTAHFHSQQFSFPIVVESETWSTQRLGPDRLQARFLAETLSDGRNLRETLTISPLGKPRTLRLLFLLTTLGMVHLEREPTSATKVMAEGELLQILRRRLDQGAASHFAALSVHYVSPMRELAPALEQIIGRYGPRSQVALTSPGTKKLGEEIIKAARAAWTTLSDRRHRIEYRKELLSETEIRGAVDLLCGKYKLAKYRGFLELAEELAEVAEELEPGAIARSIV